MNTKAIEITAVSLLKAVLSRTGHLIPEIPDNDRSPSWDGEVLAYSGDSDKKDQLIGKIRVQVKGKYSSSIKNGTCSFSLDRSDLVNFKNNGGAILFVVYLNEKEHQILCNDLTPEKLKYYLGKARKKSSRISIPVVPLPSEADTMTDYVINAIHHCRMQTSYANSPIQTIDSFIARPDFKGLELPHFGLSSFNPVSFLLNGESTYFYGRTDNSLIPIPLEYQEIIRSEVCERIPQSICVKGTEYYSSITRIYSKDCVTCRIGESISIIQIKGRSDVQLNITLCDEVHNRARDLAFITAAFEANGFEFNNSRFPLDASISNDLPKLLAQWKADYGWCYKAVRTLNALHCKKEVFLSRLSDIDRGNLNCLIDGIANNNTHLKLNESIPDISFIKIGELRFLLHKIKDQSTGFCSIEDFYTSEVQIAVSADQTDYIVTSQFEICDKNTLLESDNLYLPALLPDYKRFGFRDHIVSGANNKMLQLIEAYDDTGDDRFLSTASSFSKWLKGAPDEFLSPYIRVINELQIAKRTRTLTEEEKSALYEMVDCPKLAPQYKVAAYALLDNQSAAVHYFGLLTEEQKAQISNHPIDKYINGDLKDRG